MNFDTTNYTVFDTFARPVVDAFLQGISGTLNLF